MLTVVLLAAVFENATAWIETPQILASVLSFLQPADWAVCARRGVVCLRCHDPAIFSILICLFMLPIQNMPV